MPILNAGVGGGIMLILLYPLIIFGLVIALVLLSVGGILIGHSFKLKKPDNAWPISRMIMLVIGIVITTITIVLIVLCICALSGVFTPSSSSSSYSEPPQASEAQLIMYLKYSLLK